jgi:hypothetical protein
LRDTEKRASRKRPANKVGALSPNEISQRLEAISNKDRKQIARLVGKHGREIVLAAVTASPEPRSRGRPSRGNLPIYEAVHLAQWFEEEVEEHRGRGSAHPIRDAEIALYDIEKGREPDDLFEAWRLNTKKKRLRGSRYLKQIRQTAEARSRATSSGGRK